jgi:type IV fimbrial biogenesis protein FimT
MTRHPPLLSCHYKRGFTLIELLVTIAIAALLAKLAAPSIQDFIVKSRMTGIGSQFTNGILRARSEAVNRNTCTIMCLSTNTSDAVTTDTSGNVTAGPTCSNSGTDWQTGWIIFLKEDCVNGTQAVNNRPVRPEDYIAIQDALSESYSIKGYEGSPPTAGSSPTRFFFQASGGQTLSGAGRFDLQYQGNSKYTERYGFNICVDAMGKTRTVSWNSAC